MAVELDVTASGAVIAKSVRKAWDAFGRIDVLVNNAGVRAKFQPYRYILFITSHLYLDSLQNKSKEGSCLCLLLGPPLLGCALKPKPPRLLPSATTPTTGPPIAIVVYYHSSPVTYH
ncbi:hypothetical protein ACLOJK_008257 [Asimina triloba]